MARPSTVTTPLLDTDACAEEGSCWWESTETQPHERSSSLVW